MKRYYLYFITDFIFIKRIEDVQTLGVVIKSHKPTGDSGPSESYEVIFENLTSLAFFAAHVAKIDREVYIKEAKELTL